jgi:hypothetical protein
MLGAKGPRKVRHDQQLDDVRSALIQSVSTLGYGENGKRAVDSRDIYDKVRDKEAWRGRHKDTDSGIKRVDHLLGELLRSEKSPSVSWQESIPDSSSAPVAPAGRSSPADEVDRELDSWGDELTMADMIEIDARLIERKRRLLRRMSERAALLSRETRPRISENVMVINGEG